MKESKIRFTRKNVGFEKYHLCDIASINPKTNVPTEFEYVDLESVSGTEMISHRTEKKSTAPSRAQRLAKYGDIFYQTVRPYQKNNYYFDIKADNYVFSTGYAQIRSSINGKYLFTLLQSDAFLRQVLDNCSGTSFPAINPSTLSKLIINICTDSVEQERVATFFTSLDAQISASTSRLASLKQVKAASLQAMFPQEGETVPKVRFKGFEGEWKKVKLNTFAKRIMRKNSNLESSLALTIASAYGLVSQAEYFNNLVVGSNIQNYYLLKKGEFAYNKSYSNGYPFGSVKRLDRYEQGILSTLYIVFSIDNSVSSDYITHFFDTTLWHKEIAERAEEGARNHGLLNIATRDFFDIYIWMPDSVKEQQSIASFFTSLDRQIALHTQRLEKLKQIKAACLDKMFV